MELIHRLRDFVQGIRDYYQQHHLATENTFTIARAMVNYGMSAVTKETRNEVLEFLVAKRLIVTMDEREVTFAHSFFEQ